MKLPNMEQLRIDRDKLTGYLLSPPNPRGRSKANFFLGFGFNTDSWRRLAKALEVHAASCEVTKVVETSYGQRYYVDGPIETPDGRNPVIRTVWQVDLATTYPRLITAHPLRR